MELAIGDRVRLRSGGPVMTVTKIFNNEVENVKCARCVWFWQEGPKEDSFPVAALDKE